VGGGKVEHDSKQWALQLKPWAASAWRGRGTGWAQLLLARRMLALNVMCPRALGRSNRGRTAAAGWPANLFPLI
jgi:hypothetical protein